jgi:hypothetical protein
MARREVADPVETADAMRFRIRPRVSRKADDIFCKAVTSAIAIDTSATTDATEVK